MLWKMEPCVEASVHHIQWLLLFASEVLLVTAGVEMLDFQQLPIELKVLMHMVVSSTLFLNAEVVCCSYSLVYDELGPIGKNQLAAVVHANSFENLRVLPGPRLPAMSVVLR
jgi:hypothetical protein